MLIVITYSWHFDCNIYDDFVQIDATSASRVYYYHIIISLIVEEEKEIKIVQD